MSKINQLVAVAMALVGLALAVPAGAQSKKEEKVMKQFVETMRGDLRAQRDSAMQTLVQVEGEEAKQFWALLKEYDKELGSLTDDRLALMKKYAAVHDKLTADVADDLADQFFDLDKQLNGLRRKYFKKMSREISPVVAVQFLQLQGQFETMGRLKLQTIAPVAVR